MRYRAGFAYIDGVLADGEVLRLCRLRYAGSARDWGFAIYRASDILKIFSQWVHVRGPLVGVFGDDVLDGFGFDGFVDRLVPDGLGGRPERAPLLLGDHPE